MTDSTRRDTTTGDRLLALAALLGFGAVALGAFGAHGLRAMLEGASDATERRAWWETGAHYQLAHALACGLAAWAYERRPSRAALVSAACFAIGAIVFAGTLYAMALGAPRVLGAVTPLGGVSMLAGWIALALAALRR